MAAGFPPNLDDGELWLPSNIFPDVGVCRRHDRQSSSAVEPEYAPDNGYIEDLAQQLAAFGLLGPNDPFSALKTNPNRPPRPEVFVPGWPVARFGPAHREMEAGFAYDRFRTRSMGRVASVVGTGAFLPDPRPLPKLNPVKPSQAQVDGFGQGRARVSQRKLSCPNRFIPPVRTSGSGRGCVGTGVFLPRVSVNDDVSKKQNTVKGGEQQKQQPTRNAALMRKKKQGVSSDPVPKMGLPHDWTY